MIENTLLEVTGLTAGYETGQVLSGVDIHVDDGDLVSLLGRNGAGKTTLLETVMGGDEPRVLEGTVRVRGEDVVGQPPDARAQRGLSFVPEERRCFPRLSVEEHIRLAINHAQNPLTFESVLSVFPELVKLRERVARELSGGEQQLLAIARGLAANPDLLLLDEPFEGLAPFIVLRIEDILTEINEKGGIAVLFVEQNVAAAVGIASRHYILDEGQIVAEVTTAQLRADERLSRRYLGV